MSRASVYGAGTTSIQVQSEGIGGKEIEEGRRSRGKRNFFLRRKDSSQKAAIRLLVMVKSSPWNSDIWAPTYKAQWRTANILSFTLSPTRGMPQHGLQQKHFFQPSNHIARKHEMS